MNNIEIIRTIITEFPFAVLGSTLAGILCGFLGVYVVSKRIVFVGATLTQIAVTGFAFAHLPLIEINPLIGSVIFTLLAVLLFSQLLQSKVIPRDGVLGISFILALAVRILLIQKSPAAEVSEIETILKGDILFVNSEQFYILLGVAILIFVIHTLFYKEFIFVSFDSETAATQGLNTNLWEIFFYLTIGIAISVATRIVGDIFVFGFLILPSISSMLISKNVVKIFLLAILLGAIPPILGLFLAFKLDLPAGPTAVATSFIILLISWILSKFQK